jgi:hypothetical protein
MTLAFAIRVGGPVVMTEAPKFIVGQILPFTAWQDPRTLSTALSVGQMPVRLLRVLPHLNRVCCNKLTLLDTRNPLLLGNVVALCFGQGLESNLVRCRLDGRGGMRGCGWHGGWLGLELTKSQYGVLGGKLEELLAGDLGARLGG